MSKPESRRKERESITRLERVLGWINEMPWRITAAGALLAMKEDGISVAEFGPLASSFIEHGDPDIPVVGTHRPVADESDRLDLLITMRDCLELLTKGRYDVFDGDLPVYLKTALRIGDDGRVVATMPIVLELLDGIHADRIRTCCRPRCPHLFYAHRSDQKACSRACANYCRVRLHRDKVKAREAKRRQRQAAKQLRQGAERRKQQKKGN